MMINSNRVIRWCPLVLTWLICLKSVHGQDRHLWRLTTTLSAPEAFQAAAADRRFAFAISSTIVAKYDRQGGQRLAISVGEAQHLNSGFLWNDLLICAHSNYPQTPERSQIKALDTQSMQLSTWHDFGNFGGSLTWVVRYDGHWWCNFAKYGDENAQTFLVKFTDTWQERARWTYPEELTRAVRPYSLSGGLWRDNFLLVTDHDHPILFRLKLPNEGHVLELVDRQHVPFTGQGIALDPVDQGLVGIDRARRLIVFVRPIDEARR